MEYFNDQNTSGFSAGAIADMNKIIRKWCLNEGIDLDDYDIGDSGERIRMIGDDILDNYNDLGDYYYANGCKENAAEKTS